MRWYLYGGAGLLIVLLLFAYSRASRMEAPDFGEIKFGFVTALEGNGEYRVVFDEAAWLTGTEAENAAIAAGVCTEARRAECLPNNFYISNPATTTVSYAIAPDVIIAMLTLTMETDSIREEQISPQDYARLINDTSLHWRTVPYQILVNDGKVTIIEEVYIP